MTRIQDFKYGDMYLVSGRTIRPAEMTADDVDPVDIVHSIIGTPRFNGHLPTMGGLAFTVGQHTLAMYIAAKVMEETEGVRQMILLHDLHEYITGDIPTPVKSLLGPEIGKLERHIDEAIFTFFQHIPTPAETARCKEYDALMWQVELQVIRDMDWDRLPDDLQTTMARTVAHVSTMDPMDVGTKLVSAFQMEFYNEEARQ